jgi:hypothetical protein
VTQFETLDPLETLPDSQRVKRENGRSLNCLVSLLMRPFAAIRARRLQSGSGTKNNLFDQGDQLDQVTENTGLGGE